MTTLTMGRRGEISLPVQVRDRYGLEADTPIRVIETPSGVLLVPITDAPMSPELARELEEWQSLGADAWAMFSYEED